MKKLFSLSLAALGAVYAMAAPKNVEVQTSIQRQYTLKTATPEYVETAKTVSRAAAVSESAPASVVGMSFVTTYTDIKNNYNGFFTVAEGDAGTVILQNFAEGFDVNATYDASTGKLTIPTGVVIGTYSTYGDVTLYALTPDGTKYSTDDITGTFDGNQITFDNGVYATVSAGYLVLMSEIKATEANAKITYSLSTNSGGTVTYSNPLIITKPSETSLKIVGISGILYGAYYEVTASINAAAKTATIAQGTVVDTYNNTFYALYGINSVGFADNLEMSVVTSDVTSLLKADKMLYAYANGTSLNGYQFSNVMIDVDFNIFTGETTGDGDENGDTDTPTIDGISYLIDRDNKTATVTGCLATITTLSIPSTISVSEADYTVTAIAEGAFINNKIVTTISLPATIKEIGTDAFRNMSGVTKIYIADLASWCAVDIANGNANPIYNAFPTSTSKWGTVYFNNEAVADAIEIPEGVTAIGRSFYGFKSLKSVSLPSSVETIGDQAFSGCNSLTEITIPENVKSIGSAFFSCTGLKTVTFKGAPETIEKTFYGCKNLESVNLGEGIVTIGTMTFSSCSSLKTLSLPSTLKTIGMMAFSSCDNLTEIRSAATVPPTALSYAFDDIDTTIPVYVPEASIDAYKAAAEWSEFTNYLPLSATSSISSIENDSNEPAVYYNLNGVRVANPTSGLFIKKQGNTVTKVLVK